MMESVSSIMQRFEERNLILKGISEHLEVIEQSPRCVHSEWKKIKAFLAEVKTQVITPAEHYLIVLGCLEKSESIGFFWNEKKIKLVGQAPRIIIANYIWSMRKQKQIPLYRIMQESETLRKKAWEYLLAHKPTDNALTEVMIKVEPFREKAAKELLKRKPDQSHLIWIFTNIPALEKESWEQIKTKPLTWEEANTLLERKEKIPETIETQALAMAGQFELANKAPLKTLTQIMIKVPTLRGKAWQQFKSQSDQSWLYPYEVIKVINEAIGLDEKTIREALDLIINHDFFINSLISLIKKLPAALQEYLWATLKTKNLKATELAKIIADSEFFNEKMVRQMWEHFLTLKYNEECLRKIILSSHAKCLREHAQWNLLTLNCTDNDLQQMFRGSHYLRNAAWNKLSNRRLDWQRLLHIFIHYQPLRNVAWEPLKLSNPPKTALWKEIEKGYVSPPWEVKLKLLYLILELNPRPEDIEKVSELALKKFDDFALLSKAQVIKNSLPN